MPKFGGPAPGRRAVRMKLRELNWTYENLAAYCGPRVSVSHIRTCLGGVTHPMPEVRDRLPKLVGMPLEDIFHAEALAKPYADQFNPWKELAS